MRLLFSGHLTLGDRGGPQRFYEGSSMVGKDCGLQANILPTQLQIDILGEARTCQDGPTTETMVVEIMMDANSLLRKNQNWTRRGESLNVRKMMKMRIKEIQRFRRYQGQKWIPLEPQSGTIWLLCKRSTFLLSTRAISVMGFREKNSPCLHCPMLRFPGPPV